MKQIRPRRAMLLLALGTVLLHTPVFGSRGNVRGIHKHSSHLKDGFGEVDSPRLLKKGRMHHNVNSNSFEEPDMSVMFDSGDMATTQESSGDAEFAPGDGSDGADEGSPDEPDPPTDPPVVETDPPVETLQPTDPAPTDPGNVVVNVSIAYMVGVNGTDASPQLAAEITVAKSGGGRRRAEAHELGPDEPEIDTLINNTFDFYSQVYQDSFGETLVSMEPVGVITQDVSPELFILNFEALLAFSSAPPAEEVATVSADINEDEYIEFYVRPSGPYFSKTESVGIVTEAEDMVATAEPTTPAPTTPPTAEATEPETASPTMSPTDPAIVTDAPTTAPLPETDPPTLPEPVETTPPTATPTVGEPVPVETSEPTLESEPVVTDAPTLGEPAETAAPTQAPTVATSAPTATPETPAPTAAPTVATPAPTVATPAPSVAATTGSPTIAGTQGPTECPGRSVRVIGTILLELDPEADLTEPAPAQVVEVAQHILQDFGVILREEYGNAIRGFTATIDETNTALDGNAYPLGFDADILFSPCAPPTDEVNAIFADADYPAILEDFEPTGDDNVFQHLTGEATYSGEAVIAF